jgi:CheY-like chemotaxis protein
MGNSGSTLERQEAFRILLVDDSSIDCEIAAHHLRSAWPCELNLVVETACDGSEALAKTQGTRYMLILLDWRMPKAGGGEFLRTLRNNNDSTPVVVLTGLEAGELEYDLKSLGAVFLSKDGLSPAALRTAINATAPVQLGSMPLRYS